MDSGYIVYFYRMIWR